MSALETATGGADAPPPPPPTQTAEQPPEPPQGPEDVTLHARATEDGILIALEGRGVLLGAEIDIATARAWVAALNAAVGDAFTRTLRPVKTKGN